jgi:hypothetical protein
MEGARDWDKRSKQFGSSATYKRELGWRVVGGRRGGWRKERGGNRREGGGGRKEKERGEGSEAVE